MTPAAPMKLAILGGGGFRVPLVYGALLRDAHARRVEEVVLYDADPGRLDAMRHVLGQLADEARHSRPARAGDRPEPPRIVTSTDLDVAVAGADFVFSAMRVGGLAGRTCDERVALDLGVLGQETTGPGGLAYGLRTIPVALEVARRVRALAPTAYVINFTNPAGMITEAMAAELSDRVIGICDSPIGLARRAAASVGVGLGEMRLDYLGLNHLGWLRGMSDGRGVDRLPEVLGSDARLASIEEGRLFGAEWLRTLGALPNEYLYYWYFTRDAVAAIRGAASTRGEFLLDQQSAFYAAVAADPSSALATWRRSRAEREATYLAETRAAGEERAEADLAGGGYEGVALALMAALARDEPATMILNVRAGHLAGELLPGLGEDAVVEVPCAVTAAGVTALPVSPLTGHMLGLVQQMKAVERLTIQAARERSVRLAVAAFAEHPLVDSVSVARDLLAGYRARIPQVDALFRAG